MRLDRRINPMSVACIGMLTGFLLCSTAHGQGAARYAIIDIGDIGGRGTTPRSINNQGVVVGDTLDAQTNDILGFVWRDGQVQFLDPPVPGFDIRPNDVNDAGEVAGRAVVAFNTIHAVLWDENGTPIDLGTLGGPWSEAHGINEVGQVVGQADLADSGFHAFRWQDGEMLDLGDLGERGSSANEINNLGQIVGRSFRNDGPGHRAFLWENGDMINLGTLPNGGQSMAFDINETGLIAGSARQSNGRDHAVIWEEQQIRSIHNLQIGLVSSAKAINESGQIVGFLDVDGKFEHVSGFLYEDSGPMVDITTLLPPRHKWRPGFSAFDINDHGEIVGHAYLSSGFNRAYLLTPVVPTLNLLGPQPGTANTVNGIRATGCTPGERIHFYYSTTGGGTLVPGCRHTDGVTLQLENPIHIGAATANEHGVATLTRFVPGQARNLGDILIQAVQPDGCKISQLVVHQFE